MFAKLFGAKKPEPKPVVRLEPLDNSEQIENLERRIRMLEHKATDAKKDAIAKKKKGDNRGAVMKLK